VPGNGAVEGSSEEGSRLEEADNLGGGPVQRPEPTEFHELRTARVVTPLPGDTCLEAGSLRACSSVVDHLADLAYLDRPLALEQTQLGMTPDGTDNFD
jgi:hypothetical protein